MPTFVELPILLDGPDGAETLADINIDAVAMLRGSRTNARQSVVEFEPGKHYDIALPVADLRALCAKAKKAGS